MSLAMDGSQNKVAEDEYSDELKELNQTTVCLLDFGRVLLQ